MRKKHIATMTRKVAEGDFGWVFRQILKGFTIPFSVMMNRTLAGPIFGGLIVTYKCNMKCLMCDLWRRQGPELTLEQWKKVVDAYKKLGVSGIGISGGEPLLRKDIFDLIAYIRKTKGIPVAISTNGYFLKDEGTVSQLFEAGIDSIAISLDSIVPKAHNKIRGISDAYQRAIKGIQNIMRYRRKKQGVNFTLSMVINRANVDDIFKMIEFGKKLGVDGVSFLPGQIMGLENEIDRRKEKLFLTSQQTERIDYYLDKLVEMKRRGEPIDNSEKYLRLLKHYFRGEKLPVRCLAEYTSLYVDAFGDIYPCFAWVEMKRKVGNIKEVNLAKFWKAGEYNEMRKKIAKCRDCYFSCQVELGLMYHRGKI